MLLPTSSKALIFGTTIGVMLLPVVVSAQWTPLGADIDGEVPAGAFGSEVALSSIGTRVAVGAPLVDGVGTVSGQVRVFQWVPPGWIQMGGTIEGEGSGDRSGSAVAISSDGSVVAVGEPFYGGSVAGRVRVFAWHTVTSAWILLDPAIEGEAASEFSGFSVSLSADGTRIVIGAPGNNGGSGLARVYERVGPNWVQLGFDLDGEAWEDQAGCAVAFSANGSRVAVGARLNDNSGGVDSGHVRVYRWSVLAQNWLRVGDDIDGESAGIESGSSVDLSEDGFRVVIGAPSSGVRTGQVRVYEWTGSIWNQLGSEIDGEASGDWFGTSVAISNNGNLVAIGAPGNDGNGTDSGHVRVYQWSAATQDWQQVGPDLDGESADDGSGFSVDLSSNGARLAVGAPRNVGEGDDAGHVRVYSVEIFADGFESGSSGNWSISRK